MFALLAQVLDTNTLHLEVFIGATQCYTSYVEVDKANCGHVCPLTVLV